ncbi:MAG: hypothetical protein AB7F50_00625 [Fimbriimonadaceae bacterium]
MTIPQYIALKLSLGVLATLGLYSVLFKETRFYRFFEHIFLGLAAGYTLVATWTDTLYQVWWQKMMGQFEGEGPKMAEPGYWVYAALLPIGLMGYTVFSKKNNWMSRIPIGIILGMWSGQQILVWWNTYGPQLYSTMQPIWPTNWSSLTKPPAASLSPEQAAEAAASLYPSQALTNVVFVLTFLAAFSYFIFSFDLKSKFFLGFNKLGRWMLMIGFGAIFGSTVMGRFALEIDRMAFIWIEWIQSLRALGG